ncbi:MAG: hypothetical protein AB7F28_04575 [Candidatus Margulisiibacteriota bacterium]
MFQKKFLSCSVPALPVVVKPVLTMTKPILFSVEVGSVVVATDGFYIKTSGAKMDFVRRVNDRPLGMASVSDGVVLISAKGASCYKFQDNGLRYKGALGVISNPTAIASHGDFFCLGSRDEVVLYQLNNCSAAEQNRIPVSLGGIQFLAMPDENTVVGIVRKDDSSYSLFVAKERRVQETPIGLFLGESPTCLAVSLEKNEISVGIGESVLQYKLDNLNLTGSITVKAASGLVYERKGLLIADEFGVYCFETRERLSNEPSKLHLSDNGVILISNQNSLFLYPQS